MGYLSIFLAKDVKNLTNLMEKLLTNILSRTNNSDDIMDLDIINIYLYLYEIFHAELFLLSLHRNAHLWLI